MGYEIAHVKRKMKKLEKILSLTILYALHSGHAGCWINNNHFHLFNCQSI